MSDPNPLKVCFISAEYSPLAKTGGLADVVGSLSRDLSAMGHAVATFIPAYRAVLALPVERRPVAGLSNLVLELGPHRYTYSILEARDPSADFTLYLVDCPELYDRASLYGSGPDEHRRFLLLTRAALETCQRLQFAPDVVHAHDWHAAFAPLLLRTVYSWDRLFAGTRTALTIHNLGYQGEFPASDAPDLNLGAGAHYLHQDDLRAGRVNALRHGILYADLVTTVSPTYAREICTAESGMGLDGDLRARGDAVRGILNGVDYREWNPATDRYVPHAFSADDKHGKRAAKAALMTRLGIIGGSRTPLFGLISRLVWQKGIDLVVAAVSDVFRRRDGALVALGAGEQAYEAGLASLADEFPGRVVFHKGYSDELAHWIEAGADAFLMPSRYEPCGLNQMYSLRYGTVPVVHRTGGLADSVVSFDPSTGQGTGVLFDHADPAGLIWAMDRTLDLYADEGGWARLKDNGMRCDFSAARQAGDYVAAYRALLGR